MKLPSRFQRDGISFAKGLPAADTALPHYRGYYPFSNPIFL
jgi:hypothetical protein